AKLSQGSSVKFDLSSAVTRLNSADGGMKPGVYRFDGRNVLLLISNVTYESGIREYILSYMTIDESGRLVGKVEAVDSSVTGFRRNWHPVDKVKISLIRPSNHEAAGG